MAQKESRALADHPTQLILYRGAIDKFGFIVDPESFGEMRSSQLQLDFITTSNP